MRSLPPEGEQGEREAKEEFPGEDQKPERTEHGWDLRIIFSGQRARAKVRMAG